MQRDGQDNSRDLMNLTPELRTRFLHFREAYETRRLKMIEDGAHGYEIAAVPWKAAQEAEPLTPDELRLYKKLVAMHSVNGGEIFAV
jgi:hypothetical protein